MLFVSSIDHGSIARAAEREHIVASAASKRIGDLETGLGVVFPQLPKDTNPTTPATGSYSGKRNTKPHEAAAFLSQI